MREDLVESLVQGPEVAHVRVRHGVPLRAHLLRGAVDRAARSAPADDQEVTPFGPEHLRCPDGLADPQHLLMAETRGKFEELVNWIDQAEDSTWSQVLRELAEKHPDVADEGNIDDVGEDELL